ncbi:MAG: sugar-binding transcriptional regulator [Firmicutes bacterium]|nr:sugar-binding transcriptional regulator [Bacillota bacterium]
MARSVRDERRLKVDIARRYYLDGATQTEIAEALGLSRMAVQRILAQCRKEQIVEITIKDPICNCLALEDEVKSRFSLVDAVIVNSPADPSLLQKNIARFAARYLTEHLTPGMTIGAAWGRTVFQMMQFLEPRPQPDLCPGLRVVSLMGSLSTSLVVHPYSIVNKIGEVFNAEVYYISAPAVANLPETRNIFLAEKSVQAILDLARQADIAVVGIGDVGERATLLQTGYLTLTELKELAGRGAVGEILVWHYDINGSLVESPLSPRIVGLSPIELRQIKRVIGVAGGPEKVKAILGALRGRYINVLVTDEETARELMNLDSHL